MEPGDKVLYYQADKAGNPVDPIEATVTRARDSFGLDLDVGKRGRLIVATSDTGEDSAADDGSWAFAVFAGAAPRDDNGDPILPYWDHVPPADPPPADPTPAQPS